MDLVLDREAYNFVLMCSPCLSSNGPLSMVYELLQDCFILDDYTSCGFDLFFEICGRIACGHVPPTISHLLVTS